MFLKYWRLYALSAAVAALAAVIYFAWPRPGPEAQYLEGTGVIEAAEAALAPKAAGRIEWLCCREGERIEAGAVALRLDSRELSASVEEAAASFAAASGAAAEAKAALESASVAKEGSAHDAAAAAADTDRAKALADEAAEELARAQGLFAKGYISRKEMDSARAASEAHLALLHGSKARHRGAQASVRSAQAAIEAARARVAAAEARAEQAAAQVRVLEARLDDAAVRSPIAGVVSYKAYEAGEYASQGSVVYTVYDPSDLWARVDLEETKVREIALGSRAEVAPVGAGPPFEASVMEIGELAGFATQRDAARGRPDIKTFRVKVRVASPEGFLKPGMTVHVRIHRGHAGR